MPSPSVTSPQVAVNDIGSSEDFLAAIDKRGRPIADIEEGYTSTATCILANIAMDLGRPIVYDAKKRVVVGDSDANKHLRSAYRKPWKHPAA